MSQSACGAGWHPAARLLTAQFAPIANRRAGYQPAQHPDLTLPTHRVYCRNLRVHGNVPFAPNCLFKRATTCSICDLASAGVGLLAPSFT